MPTSHRTLAAALLFALSGCASVNARAARTPEEVRARAEAERRRECTIAQEDVLRTFWLAPMFALSDPIVLGRGRFLGAPVVPRPCAPIDRDSARASPR